MHGDKSMKSHTQRWNDKKKLELINQILEIGKQILAESGDNKIKLTATTWNGVKLK